MTLSDRNGDTNWDTQHQVIIFTDLKIFGERRALSDSERDRYIMMPEYFRSAHSDYEEYLFGLDLYYQCIPRVIRWTITGSLKRISNRIEAALYRANKIIEKHMRGEDVSQAIRGFEWLEKWGPMHNRITTCLNAYISVFGLEGYNERRKLSKGVTSQLKAAISIQL